MSFPQYEANSPTLTTEIMNAVMDALAAHETMSNPALGSQSVPEGLKEVLVGPAQLYESLQERSGAGMAEPAIGRP